MLISLSTALSLVSLSPNAYADMPALVALVIDDLGYRRHEGERAVALPGGVTLSFLPGTPYARHLATLAHAKNREIMLHLPMDNGAALKLTTARYYTPAGRSIQAEGITPDIELEDLKIAQADDKNVGPVKESDLSGHLSNGDSGQSNPADEQAEAEEEEKSSAALASEDYPLYEALNLLKGLAILQAKRG